jgi:nucleotide-binding universal stress UspA family protein
MYKHILVPTDGTPLSLKAVKAAAQLAKTTKAKVTAIHVMAPFDAQMTSEGAVFRAGYLAREYEANVRANAKKVLAKATTALKESPCETLAVFDSRPWEAIVKTASKRKCDVIVMASHGRSGIASLLLGSETQKVLAHSRTPVLVCR